MVLQTNSSSFVSQQLHLDSVFGDLKLKCNDVIISTVKQSFLASNMNYSLSALNSSVFKISLLNYIVNIVVISVQN